MAIREDVVSSGISFLLDPNVVSSSIDSKIAFLRSKNLTQEEIDAAFARAAGVSPPLSSTSVTAAPAQQHLYVPSHYQQPPFGWQAQAPQLPKRDWRDWFIMATLVGGVGYGLYFISKQYLYPLVAPPTPDKLDQDKATVDEQFDKAFATLEQLAKDTESLKASEATRTDKLDKVLDDIEIFVRDSKSASRRQEDETDYLREAIKKINTNIPKSMSLNNEITEAKLKEISNEVKSLKALISQRMNAASTASVPPTSGPTGPSAPTGPIVPVPIGPSSPAGLTPSANSSSSNLIRPSSSNAAAGYTSTPSIAEERETGSLKVGRLSLDENKTSTSTSAPSKQDYISSLGGRSSPFGSNAPSNRASIPAWQMAATPANGVASSASSATSGTSSTPTQNIS